MWQKRRVGDLLDVGNSFIFVLKIGFDTAETVQVHVVDTLGNPFAMHLDTQRHVEQHRRALRSGDGEHVRETMGREANQCAWAGRPAILQGLAISAADIHLEQGAGKGIESGGVNKAIEIVLFVGGGDSWRCDCVDRGCLDIDECHVIAVIGFVVVGFTRLALGAICLSSRRA